MNTTRFNTLFSLRYAVRVLERYARMWHRLDGLLRVLAILSGSAALWVVMQHQGWGTFFGLLFALAMALEYGLRPTKYEREALSARSLYSEILARQATLSDADLEQDYQVAVDKDPVIVPDVLRRIAYNDVADEFGCDPTEREELSGVDRVIARLA